MFNLAVIKFFATLIKNGTLRFYDKMFKNPIEPFYIAQNLQVINRTPGSSMERQITSNSVKKKKFLGEFILFQ